MDKNDQRWRLKASTNEAGFMLLLVGDGDLGEALDHDPNSLPVEMKDGRILRLYDAVSEFIQGRRVIGFVVLAEVEGELPEFLVKPPMAEEKYMRWGCDVSS